MSRLILVASATEKNSILNYIHFIKRTPAAVTPKTKKQHSWHVNKQCIVGDCSTLWWTSSAGSMIPLTVRGWSSSCFHPNLVPHDYSQFHSRWFFTETDGSSQMPKYRWERSEVGEKVKGGERGRGERASHSTSSPVFGIRSSVNVTSCGMMRHEGRRCRCWSGSTGLPLCRPDSVPILLRTKRLDVCCIFWATKGSYIYF